MAYLLLIIFVILLYTVIPTVLIRVTGWGITKRLKTSGLAITFDDGPHPEYTVQVLELLKKYDIKATFFVVGSNVKKNPAIIKRMHQEGHTIGIHHNQHISNWILTPGQLRKQLHLTEKAIKECTNEDIHFYRPPWGHFNLFTLLISRKYKKIMWSGIFQDWKVESCQTTLLERLRETSDDGTILLLHDNGDTLGADQDAPRYMLEKLELFLQEKQGTKFVTLKEVL